jgi:hypothetical protein
LGEYLPSPQGVQDAEPVVNLNFPTSQAVHAAPSAPVYPATQVHIELFALENVLGGHGEQGVVAATSDEKKFAAQDVHATEPEADFHSPTPQGVHSVPSAPVYPAWQVHDVIEGLLEFEKVLSGHAVQFTDATNEYVFTSHVEHVPTPVRVLYSPAAQGVHATPSDEALYPARQVHVELPTVDHVLVGHVEHSVAATCE